MTTKSPTQVDELVGLRVRQARKSAKLSQTELAEKLGLTFQQVQKYERGANRISAGKLLQIAEVFRKDIGWFFADAHYEKDFEPATGDAPEFERCVKLLLELRSNPRLASVCDVLELVKNASKARAMDKAA